MIVFYGGKYFPVLKSTACPYFHFKKKYKNLLLTFKIKKMHQVEFDLSVPSKWDNVKNYVKEALPKAFLILLFVDTLFILLIWAGVISFTVNSFTVGEEDTSALRSLEREVESLNRTLALITNEVPEELDPKYMPTFMATSRSKEKGDYLYVNPKVKLRPQEYIRTWSGLAVTEAKKIGMPASVKIAQSILESSWGGSDLAMKGNAFFGKKCFVKGCEHTHCMNLHDDSPNDMFRTYTTAKESWEDHNNILKNDRYKYGKKGTGGYENLASNDYKGWAKCLRVNGYATDPNYDKKLVRIIEKYKLYSLDSV